MRLLILYIFYHKMDKSDIIFFVIYFGELGIYRLSEMLNKEV